jgi:hypothetical protein
MRCDRGPLLSRSLYDFALSASWNCLASTPGLARCAQVIGHSVSWSMGLCSCYHSTNRIHQSCWFDVQAVCQLYNVEQADVSFPSFYTAHVVPMQFTQLREPFLREFLLFAQLADALSEYQPRVGIRHPAILGI